MLTLCNVLIHIIMCLTFMIISNCEQTAFCPPAEEGTQHSLYFKWNITHPLSGESIIVMKDDYAIAKSSLPFINYESYFQKRYAANFTFIEHLSEATVIVTISNTSRDGQTGVGKIWFIYQDDELIGSCRIDVYYPAKDLSCTKEIVDEHLSISCWSTRVFPEAQCTGSIKPRMKARSVFNPHVKTVNKQSSRNPVYFRTNCSMKIPTADLVRDQYEVVITMFPNVTDEEVAKQFVINQTFSIDLGIPSVTLRDCPEIVEEHTAITCICERSDTSLINASFVWFESRGDVDRLLVNGSGILTFNVTRYHGELQEDFYCKAVNSFGLESSSKTFSPFVIVKALNMTCRFEHLNNAFNVSCSTKRVFPSGLCRFILYHNETSFVYLTETIYYSHVTILDKLTHYMSSCSVMLSELHSTDGLHIIITMYPNVTGNETDTQFGNNQTIYFRKATVQRVLWSSGPVFIGSILGGNLCVCLCLVIWFHRRKAVHDVLDLCVTCSENQNKSNDYDEINEGYVLAVEQIYNGNEHLHMVGYLNLVHEQPEVITVEEISVEMNVYETIDEQIIVQINNVDTASYDSHTDMAINNIISVPTKDKEEY